ncbi:MAG: hypothetical protein JNL96_20300 [Planctomycetaceae bacterium]|nr:hypothetical protein [Planctomycetaceae bacterium]
MVATTRNRVPMNTDSCINASIRRKTENNIAYYAAGGTVAISRRLAELDEEWDIERMLETNAATATLVGMTLGVTVNKKWFALPVLVAAFLLQHAVQGWCPPLPVLRRMGFRTANEIDYERYALKALRGDFRNISEAGTAGHALSAAES